MRPRSTRAPGTGGPYGNGRYDHSRYDRDAHDREGRLTGTTTTAGERTGYAAPAAGEPPAAERLAVRAALAATGDAGTVTDPPELLADRPDGTVVRVGDVVAKAHAADTDRAALATRLAVAAHPLLRGILLPPHPGRPPTPPSHRPVTVWPYGRPIDRDDPAAAPWAETAALLARLHTVPAHRLPGPLPAMRGPAKAARALARLRASDAARSAAGRTVRRAWRRLPAHARDEAPYEGPAALCHGDLHLGQLVRRPAPDGPWLLIDIDDLGAGDPAWDLARPAMWFAAGLLHPADWARFLAAYRAAGGSAVPADGDPWPRLDVPARTLAVQTAALALVKAAGEGRELDEAESELLATCGRIAQLE